MISISGRGKSMLGTTEHGMGAGEMRSPDMALPDIMAAIRRRWRWIVIPTLIALIASFLIVNVLEPKYTGEAKILLESRDSFYTRPGIEQREQATAFDPEAVQSQVQVVTSRDLAREAIRRLKLVGNPEFDPLMSGVGTLKKFMVVLGLSRNPVDRAPEDRVLSEYYERLSAYASGRSRIIAVEFRSRDPELASRAANTIAELYLEFQESSKKDTARSASSWLSGNIDNLRSRLSTAEQKVESFRSSSGLLVGGNNITITSQQLADLSGQLATARTAQADSQARAKLIRELIRNGRSFEIPDVANNELIRRLVEQRVNLRAQLALEMRTLLDGHPRIKELNAQLGDLEGQIRAAAERTVRTLENEARLAATRVDSILGVLETQKRQVAEANESEVQLRALEREAKTHRDQLESYLSKYREASARDSDNAVPPDARIISRSIVPTTASFPKKLPIIAVATLGTLVLGLGIVIGGELMGAGARPGFNSTSSSQVGRRSEPAFMDKPIETIPVAAATVAATASVISSQRFAQQVVRTEGHAPRQDHAARQDLAALQDIANGTEQSIQAQNQAWLQSAAKNGPESRARSSALNPSFAPIYVGGRDLDVRVKQEIEAQFPPRLMPGMGRRVMMILPRGARTNIVARQIVQLFAQDQRAIYVQCPPSEADPFLEIIGASDGRLGFVDLVAGDATFVDVIGRDPGSRLHHIPAGVGPAEELAEDQEALEVALAALAQTYDLVVCAVPAESLAVMCPVLAPRADSILVLADHDGGNLSSQNAGQQMQMIAPGRVIIVSMADAATNSAASVA
jgi:polysaccharide biosynthesis transport protein